jgi:hypothetical protein
MHATHSPSLREGRAVVLCCAPARARQQEGESSLREQGEMGKKSKAGSGEEEALTRVAIVNADKCKPKKCRQVGGGEREGDAAACGLASPGLTPVPQECKKMCPVVRMGKQCIEVAPNSKVRKPLRGFAGWLAMKICSCPSCCRSLTLVKSFALAAVSV